MSDSAPSSTERTECDIEVVICTYNRAKLLERTLKSVNQAKRPERTSVRVLVVANACTDNTVDFLRTYQRLAADKNWLPLRWIEEPIPGKSHALNHALLAVDSPVVAFVDDDHRVGPRYLWAVDSGTKEHPSIRLFCGRIIPDWDGSEPDWVHDDGTYKIYPLPVPRFDQGDRRKVLHPGTATPGGGNLFIRRTLFEDVGKFEPKLGPVGHNLSGAEDIHWVRRAMSMGETLQYIPEAIQYHYVDHKRLKLIYLTKKAYERSSSVVRLTQQPSEDKGIPRYVLRKILSYALSSLISVSMKKRRFFLVRLAASVGELKGFIMRRLDQRKEVINGSG